MAEKRALGRIKKSAVCIGAVSIRRYKTAASAHDLEIHSNTQKISSSSSREQKPMGPGDRLPDRRALCHVLPVAEASRALPGVEAIRGRRFQRRICEAASFVSRGSWRALCLSMCVTDVSASIHLLRLLHDRSIEEECSSTIHS
jgi:hypothetical protein